MNDHRRLVRDLRRAGLDVRRTGSGHWRVRRPDGGPTVIVSSSPRSARALTHDRARLRRLLGLDRDLRWPV